MREKENCPKLISKYIRIGRAQGNQKEPRIKAHLQNEIYFLPLSSLPYLIKTLCLKMSDKVYNLMSTNQSGLKMILHNYVPVKLLCHYDSLGRIQKSWAICF